MTRAVLFLLALLLAGSGVSPRASAEVPPILFKKMEGLAERLARGGRTDEVLTLIDAMLALEYPMPAAAALVGTCNARLAKARKPRPKMPGEAKSAASIARELAALLPDLPPEDVPTLARQVLVLDASVDEAHRALGREKVGSTWRPAGAAARHARKKDRRDALVRARRLEVDVTIAPSRNDFATALGATGMLCATAGPVRIHRACSEEKLRRITAETLRSLALVNYLLTGDLAVPKLRDSDWVTVDNEPTYRRGLRLALERGLIEKKWFDRHADLSGCMFGPKMSLQYDRMESGVEATLFSYICSQAKFEGQDRFTLHRAQPCLHAALQNWVCLGYLGTSMPEWAWLERRELPFAGTFSGLLDEARRREYEEMLRMSEAGIVGYRAWLIYLVQHGQDPKWQHAMKDVLGQVANELLLKSTFVLEYLLEEHDVFQLALRTGKDWEANQGMTAGARFERELDLPLAEFELRWRDWLLPHDRGLAQDLGGKVGGFVPTKGQLAALDRLNEIRRGAVQPIQGDDYRDVTLDEELSNGARLHAKYLFQNPEQQTMWPEAHEEFPDREGFTVEGAWAGTHSVIAPGERSPAGSIDKWMATFYHRLPLTEPGLIRIGFALENDIAVCDASSLSGPFKLDRVIVYPHSGQRSVPRSFEPELPNPVPGENQSAWGYPITVQTPALSGGDAADPVFVLRRGGAQGQIVPCHYSTPLAPTNTDLAPERAYCLIPKQTLSKNTTYHVLFEPADAGHRSEWTFATGR